MVKAIAEGIKWGERMSREEAIEILKDLWRTKYSTYLETDIRKALKMAIQALEQEPCEYAVDREQVNDILGHCIHSQEDYYLAIKMLNELPRVNPQEPSGDAVSRKELLKAIANKIWTSTEPIGDNYKYIKSISKPTGVNFWDLEQEPCEDAISRQAALKEMKESAEHHANDSREEALLRRDRDIIRALPSVKPQPKTGHWIKKDGYSDCSECGSHIVTEWDYCPKCGARMVEPQESEDKG